MSPSPGVPSTSTTAPARQFDVLVVGTRNDCRSPAAERLLRAGLVAGAGIGVRSAGTAAASTAEGSPSDPRDADRGVPADGHTARQLTADMVREADLVLTTSRAERAEVVRLVPGAVRRTFTLREAARLAEALDPAVLPGGGPEERLPVFVDLASRLRGPTAPVVPADDDVLETNGTEANGRRVALEQVEAAVRALVAAIQPSAVDQDEAERTADAAGPGPDEGPEVREVPAVSAVSAVPAVSASSASSAPPAAAPAGTSDPVAAPPPPGRRRRSPLRTVVLVVLGLLVLGVLALTLAALLVLDRLDDRIERFADPFAGLSSRPAPVVPDGADGRPVTFLVLGSTSGGTAGGGAGGRPVAAEQTDVVMLARLAADRGSMQVVAMPADLWVDVPGSGPGTLRSAVVDGGVPGAVETVEHLTDVRVDHVALTDAATYAHATDALGGVDLSLSAPLMVEGRVELPAGEHRLTGEQALLWAQEEGVAADRAEREQVWLRSIVARLGDADVQRDPARWLELLGAASSSIAVDEGLDRAAMARLAASARGLRPGDVRIVGAPTTPSPAPVAPEGATTEEEPVLVPDDEPFDALMDALRTDTLDDHLLEGSTTP